MQRSSNLNIFINARFVVVRPMRSPLCTKNMLNAGQPETTNLISPELQAALHKIQELEAEIRQLKEPYRRVEEACKGPAEAYRPESVDRTIKDPSQREDLDKVYKALKASNRLHSNQLSQQQSNRRAYSRELNDVADAVLGGQHALMDGLHASQTWDFHNCQQSDERWEKVEAFMAEVRTFMDDAMSELLKVTDTQKEDAV